MKENQDKDTIKEAMIGITQLYFDEQIDHSNHIKNYVTQQETFDVVLSSLIYAVANQFRSNYHTDPQEIKKRLGFSELL